MKPYKGVIFCARLGFDGTIRGRTLHIVTGESGAIRTSPLAHIPAFTLGELPELVETQNSRYHVVWSRDWLIEAGQAEWANHLRHRRTSKERA
jgi:hypothetical protein